MDTQEAQEPNVQSVFEEVKNVLKDQTSGLASLSASLEELNSELRGISIFPKMDTEKTIATPSSFTDNDDVEGSRKAAQAEISDSTSVMCSTGWFIRSLGQDRRRLNMRDKLQACIKMRSSHTLVIFLRKTLYSGQKIILMLTKRIG